MATEPTPPVAPVTSTEPSPGVTSWVSRACTLKKFKKINLIAELNNLQKQIINFKLGEMTALKVSS